MQKNHKNFGLLVALLLLATWLLSLAFLLTYQLNWQSVATYGFILLQTHLYTGIFITAHDAMHGLVSANRLTNKWIGRISAALFAFNNFDLLNRKHHLHHRFVASDQDPDYYVGGFWIWYFNFAKQYIRPLQIVLMAISFNLLKLVFETENLVLYWIIPSILSTFQLFYFGTYLPHKGEHDPKNVHKSRSQQQNHLWAFLSCYFFGYHYEHHDSPATPWWLLFKEKEKNTNKVY